ncbi:hypothetical protein [Bartonella japonica]|uniref:hypothetical protein n=1 Tax=Bartonella japonica TaxID=357761 RepID=UPI003393C03A
MFFSSVKTGKRSLPVGMEEKIIELYDLDQEIAVNLRRKADAFCKNFTIKSSDPLSYEIVGMFAVNLKCLSQQELGELKTREN